MLVAGSRLSRASPTTPLDLLEQEAENTMSALQIVRANKFMVEEGRMPTARDFQHYNLSEHFKTHRARMQNDMFKVGMRKAAS